jgi:tetratricopeptide (TPR) repeat protein
MAKRVQTKVNRSADRPAKVNVMPPSGAVALFERGMSAIQRHVYAEAVQIFETLVQDFPTERTLLDRARVYLDLCDRELRRRPSSAETPLSSEERLTSATLALNNGDHAQAERLARLVLSCDPKADLALYLLAVIEARRGNGDAALSHLQRAMEINPDSRAQARHDEDFQLLREVEAFHTLTEPQPAPSSSPKRPPRGR